MTILAIIIVFVILFALLRKKDKPISSPTDTTSVFDCVENLSIVDYMDGHDFEFWCADLLKNNGFLHVRVTQGSGDQGVDILAEKDGKKYAIQCKRYGKPIGNKPIQEVNTGRVIYGCDVAAVMTNQHFTRGAIDAAKAVGVLLWDRDTLAEMLQGKKEMLGGEQLNSKCPSQKLNNNLRRKDHSNRTGILLAKPINTGKKKSVSEHNKRQYNQLMEDARRETEERIAAYRAQMDQDRLARLEQKTIEYNGQDIEIPSEESTWYDQAVLAAKDYVESYSYSRIGVIEELISDGFTKEQSIYGADNCDANWNTQALRMTKEYLEADSYSKLDLIRELESDYFTHEEAVYAAEHVKCLRK